MPLLMLSKNRANFLRRSLLWLLLLCSVVFLSACSSGIYHTVKPGQTLYRISKTYNVDQHYIARVNDITDPDQVQAGARLYIPGADHVKNVTVVKSPTQQQSVTKVSSPKKISSTKTVKKTASTQVKSPTPKITTQSVAKTKTTPVEAKKVVKKVLRWPLSGKIVSSFSSQVKAGHGRGIEISAQSGSKVVAAAAGKVIYSGDGVKGYGHLIILQHENDLFTVYGFNQKNFVSQGDFVSQGERIALSGKPPSGDSARLHFEVRQGKQPVNPILYLP
jgi:lipoprotein NlpD